MPRRKRNAGDIDGRATSPQSERTNEASLAPTSGATPRKPKRTRIVSPQSSSFPIDSQDDSASSPDEEVALSQSDYSAGPLSVEHECEPEPESSIPPHIRRLIKGKQTQRHTSSSSGFINMTSHCQPLPADSDTDESSFWSAGDTSLSSTSSALLSDTSMSVQMDVVRFDWPGSPSKPPMGRHPGPPGSEADSHKIHRVRSAPNVSPDRFIPHHSTEDDALLRRSTMSTPRSVRLARHLGFVIGDGPPIGSPAEKFEERLKQARRRSNPSLVEDPVEPDTSFTQRVLAAGARTGSEQPSADPSTRLGSLSTRSASPILANSASPHPRERSPPAIARRDALPDFFRLRHSVSSESLLHDTTSRLSLDSPTSSHVTSPNTFSRSSMPTLSTVRSSLRQLPHEHALLIRSASAFPHTSTIGASGAAMSLGMSTRGKRKAMSGKPSPSSRYHMQRTPIHVYDAPEILEDYYASPFAWNHPIQDQISAPDSRAGTQSPLTSRPSSGNQTDGMLACALGASVFFSRVSGSRLLCIERLCTAESGTGMQSAVEWGTHAGGWDQALAVGQTKGGISVWDVRTKQHILDLRRPSPSAHSSSLNFNSPSPSQVCAISWNRNLLAAGLNGCSLLWDMRCAPRLGGAGRQGGGEAFKLNAHGAHKVCGVKWRDDGEMLATGGDDNIVCVWDVRMPRRPVLASGPENRGERNGNSSMPVGQTPMWRKRRHTGAVKALAWCPWAPNILASGGGKQDGTACFWNVQTGALKETLALGSQITSIAFSPVCREFVTTHGFRCTATSPQVVPPSNPAPSAPPRFQTYDPHPPSDNDLPTPTLQETANSIVTHAYPSLARVAHVPNLHGMRISHASLSPDGSRLMTGGTFEALVMWSVWGAVGKEVDEGIGSAVGMIR
ncbi:ubiquitin-protein transferase activating protein [Ceratobasidium sp. 414]|nr:ubiquitin-protein transferase activating protein [Ceratobasidium sp. 414]